MSPSYVEFVKNQASVNIRDTLVQTSNNPAPKLLNYPIDLDVNSLIINDAHISDELAGAITDGEILETMDWAAGTLTLHVQDASRTLIHGLLSEWVDANTPVVMTSRVGQRRARVLPKEWNEIYCTLDGRDYALVQVNKRNNQFDLIFENRAIHELRKYTTPRVWYRDTYTRAMVFQSMCREVRNYFIEFYAPELDIIQPIKTTKGLPSPHEVKSKKKRGFAKGTTFTIKGHKASTQQRAHIETVLRVGDSVKASYNELLAALIAVIELSNASPKGIEFLGGSGLFDFLNSTNEAADAHAFFSNAKRQSAKLPGSTPDMIAWLVETANRPGTSFTVSEFGRWISEGQTILNEWGTSLTGGSVSYTEYNRYAFKRGLDGQTEDSWNCMVRLAKEVNWRCFSTDNIIWYVSDNDLRYSIPYDTISEASQGINTIDYEIDTGKKLNAITIYCDIDRWQAPPGVPIVVTESGPANGRWLVYEVRRPLFQKTAEITCHLPSPPIAEPAPTTKRVSLSGSKLGRPVAITGNAKVDAAYAKAIAVSNKHYPYVYGGGHTSDFSPNGGGYDCSGYVSAILNAAGLLSSPEATPSLISWGKAGHGRMMTVWVNPNPGQTGHTFIEFNLPPPAGHVQANTSHGASETAPNVNPGQGAAVIPWGGNGLAASQSGNFFPRHWPGT